MIEQPQRNNEIEKLLQRSDLISAICKCLNQKLIEMPVQARAYSCLPPSTRISYCNQLLSGHEPVLNAVGTSIKGLYLPGTSNVLLLIDPDPQANWAHPCWIAVAEFNHNVSRSFHIADANYPPMETTERRVVHYSVPAQILAA